MINNALYKSGLFFTAGAVERETGTTDLARLGGLGPRMPVTFACFLIMAAAISGVPPLNGFFSKELVYGAALERSVFFYLAALLGSFFTAASFLKLGHAAFLGPRRRENDGVREAPISMLVPMVAIAATCVLFGVWNTLPLRQLIQPVLGEGRLLGHDFSGWPREQMMVLVTLVVLVGSLLNHAMGARAFGSGLSAVDHIHYAPRLKGIYARAERGSFDPYNWGTFAVRIFASAAWHADRALDWAYDRLTPGLSGWLGQQIRNADDGNHQRYIAWSLAGALAVLIFLARAG
jgi:NADH:ubiquinone oxidoreductase subunit 5 (subunit L)/multisubunit Na+/H+ antiporter MnhA subunit